MTDNLVSSRLRARALEAAELGFNPALDDEAADLLDSQARRIADLERALRFARQHIVNAVELGFMRMPDSPDDPAHQTLPTIDAALSGTTPPAGDALVEAFELVLKRLCDANHKDESDIRKVLSDALTAHRAGKEKDNG